MKTKNKELLNAAVRVMEEMHSRFDYVSPTKNERRAFAALERAIVKTQERFGMETPQEPPRPA